MGRKLAKERGWKKPILETYYETALQLIETGEKDNHAEKIIIKDCRVLVNETKAKIVHLLREGNRCADLLSKVGTNQGQ